MLTRNGSNWLAVSLMPIGAGGASSGVGAFLHLYAGMSPGVVVAVTAVVTIVTCIAAVFCALAPHLHALCRERSLARVRCAALEGTISVKEAVSLIRAEVHLVPSVTTSQLAVPAQPVTPSRRRRNSGHSGPPAAADGPR